MTRLRPLGLTRSRVARNHALIAPDSHVEVAPVGWQGAMAITLISPALGAVFYQYLVRLEHDGRSGPPPSGVERFVYVLAGGVALRLGGQESELAVGGYAWLPPEERHELSAREPSRLLVCERRYQPLAGVAVPPLVVGRVDEVEASPFLGDPDARLQVLLPETPGFDLAMNVFTYAPGATLPFVEVHVMEHGLLMLTGAGIYRLDDAWYPVEAGDVLWMGPYCAQWFAAIGKSPASYLYYKDMHRDPLAAPTERQT